MYALDGRVGLVTGGGGGIGRAIAHRLARDGMAVVVLDSDGGAAQMVASGIGGLAVTADVTEPEAVGRAVDATLARFAKIDDEIRECLSMSADAIVAEYRRKSPV